jgi:hypothetical protein
MIDLAKNPTANVMSLLAGMVAGADSIEDVEGDTNMRSGCIPRRPIAMKRPRCRPWPSH